MTTQDQTTAALEAARAATDEALAVAQNADAGTALVPTGADAAVAVKAQMAHAHAAVSRARREALEKVNSAREAIKVQQRELERQAAALAAELEPLQEKVALMQEGIWTMNLYLGRDEEIIQIADGEPAPAGTPIHVRQLVLAMDEESAINADGNGIDISGIEAFDQWVAADPAHLHQMLPEERGVVAIMARRTEIDYGDVWTNVQKNAANRHTYWLIRNGRRVYRMDTEFEVGTRLVPGRTEFTDMFVDRRSKEPLRPGTKEWMDAETLAGARERHFMRVALILQGLIDRTPVFHPLPKPGVSLLTPQDYDEGHVVLVADDEHSLTTGRDPFYTWVARLNGQLRPGMRVMITTRHRDWPSPEGKYGEFGHSRITPPKAEYPAAGQSYVIKRPGVRSGEFVVTYKRTREEWVEESWGEGEFRVPKSSASCVIKTNDKFVLPLDLVDVPTMRTYLGARLERHAYADMFPTLTAAIAFKEAEAAAEAPFRDLLAAQVALAEDVDPDTARQLIDPVITTWKVGARWFRPMTGDPAAEARAAKEILAERARIARANAGAGDDETFLARAHREHPDALLIARKKDGTYVVLTPAPREWPPTYLGKKQEGVPDNIWVHQHEYTRTGRARPVKEWVVPTMAQVSRWIVLEESDSWGTWNRAARAGDHLSDPELNAAISQIRDHRFEGVELMAIEYEEIGGWWNSHVQRQFTAWYHPGAPRATDRPLTAPVKSLYAYSLPVTATKDSDGAITLQWPNLAPSQNNTTRWDRPFRHLGDTSPDREPVPWNDNRGERILFVDPITFAAARADLDVTVRAEEQYNRLERVVDRLMHGPEDAWVDVRVAEARARFMEDFADEDLWAQEEKKFRKGVRKPWRGREGEMRPWYALRYAVRRLVEDDAAPWGLTASEAVALLGEPLNPKEGARGFHQHGYEKDTFEEELPEDLRDLRFPNEPTGTDLSVTRSA